MYVCMHVQHVCTTCMYLSLFDPQPLRAVGPRPRQEILHRLALQVVQPVQRVEGVYLFFALRRGHGGHQRKAAVRGAAPDRTGVYGSFHLII